MRQLFAVAILLTLQLVLGQEFQCTLEKDDSGERCVFRGINMGKNSTGIKFTYPADVAKPTQVAFVDSNMKQLPSDFWALAGPELKVLQVENCSLVSISIPSGLEELYAKDNSIEEVIVQQGGSGAALRKLDLSGNQLSVVSYVTNCPALEVLNLSGNKLGEVLDLGNFKGLHKLRQLNLSHNEINYLNNTGDVNLGSLEDLDLSHNNILPSDLNIAIFYPFTKLNSLRFNDNFMAQLDYNHLLNIKSLKTVHLNGNNFQCVYLDTMLKHLQQNNLQTPPGERTSCPEQTLNDFCCAGPLPSKPTPPTTKPVGATEPQLRTATEQPNVSSPVEEEADDECGSWASWMWIAVGMGVAVGVLVVVLGVVVLKKQ